MNFYLAMSLERLIITLVCGYALIVLINFLTTKLIPYKPSLYARILSLVMFTGLILYSAINVGVRQEDLNRSSFNTQTQTQEIEKIDLDRLDSKAVKTQFNNSVGKQDQNEKVSPSSNSSNVSHFSGM